jgi:hypothetical protein
VHAQSGEHSPVDGEEGGGGRGIKNGADDGSDVPEMVEGLGGAGVGVGVVEGEEVPLQWLAEQNLRMRAEIVNLEEAKIRAIRKTVNMRMKLAAYDAALLAAGVTADTRHLLGLDIDRLPSPESRNPHPEPLHPTRSSAKTKDQSHETPTLPRTQKQGLMCSAPTTPQVLARQTLRHTCPAQRDQAPRSKL